MRPRELRIECPTCRKEVVRSSERPAPFFPFCCERCKLIDLGKWLSEEHRIEGRRLDGSAGEQGADGGR